MEKLAMLYRVVLFIINLTPDIKRGEKWWVKLPDGKGLELVEIVKAGRHAVHIRRFDVTYHSYKKSDVEFVERLL